MLELPVADDDDDDDDGGGAAARRAAVSFLTIAFASAVSLAADTPALPWRLFQERWRVFRILRASP